MRTRIFLAFLIYGFAAHAANSKCSGLEKFGSIKAERVTFKQTKFAIIAPQSSNQLWLEFKSYAPTTGESDASVTLVLPDDEPQEHHYTKIPLTRVNISDDKRVLTFTNNEGTRFTLELKTPLSEEGPHISTYDLSPPYVGPSGPTVPQEIRLGFLDRKAPLSVIRDPILHFEELSRSSLYGKLEEYRFLTTGDMGEVSIMLPQIRETGSSKGMAVFFRLMFSNPVIGRNMGQPMRYRKVDISLDKKRLTFSSSEAGVGFGLILNLLKPFEPGKRLVIGDVTIITPDIVVTETARRNLKTIDTSNINFKGTEAQEIRDKIFAAASVLPRGSLYYRGLICRDSVVTVLPGNSTMSVQALLEGLRDLGLRSDHPIFNLAKDIPLAPGLH